MTVLLGIGAGATILALAAFLGLYRPWQMNWGAAPAEIERTMAGDDIVRRPVFNATRGVTVEARPGDIWPWIVQIGFRRAGWYSYDLLDNAGRRSAERILPELQHLEVGDRVPMGPGEKSGILVKELVPGRSMLWWSGKDSQTTWAWGLYPTPEGGTRLLTRVRAPISLSNPVSAVWLAMVELADFPMMRKCLLGIKRRAEAHPAGSSQGLPAPRPPAGTV